MSILVTKEEVINKFTPAFDMVLIKISKGGEKTEGGIILPTQSRDADANESLVGEVVSIGDRVLVTINEPLEKGDSVIFTKFSGNKIFVDDEAEYRCVKAINLQGVFKK